MQHQGSNSSHDPGVALIMDDAVVSKVGVTIGTWRLKCWLEADKDTLTITDSNNPKIKLNNETEVAENLAGNYKESLRFPLRWGGI